MGTCIKRYTDKQYDYSSQDVQLYLLAIQKLQEELAERKAEQKRKQAMIQKLREDTEGIYPKSRMSQSQHSGNQSMSMAKHHKLTHIDEADDESSYIEQYDGASKEQASIEEQLNHDQEIWQGSIQDNQSKADSQAEKGKLREFDYDVDADLLEYFNLNKEEYLKERPTQQKLSSGQQSSL